MNQELAAAGLILANRLFQAGLSVSQRIAEGTLTEEHIAEVLKDRDEAEARLNAAIARAKSAQSSG